MQDISQAIITLTALVNPAMCIALFLNGVSSFPPKRRALNAFKAVVVICLVLSLSAMLGAKILSLFGVSIPAFSFAGGGIICVIGVKMLLEAKSAGYQPEEKEQTADANLTPLVLFAASPGTITGVITISSSQTGTAFPLSALIAVLSVSLILLVVLLVVSYLPTKNERPGMARQMITSYLGVIVIAMGVQFAFTGIKQFMY
ncbi:MAG: MarC family protein [Desulfocapsaceae bacterium]